MEIFENEQKIDRLLDHNIKKYKYVGEEGCEYSVIQSIFSEINKLHELSNKHIRWYSVIIYLVMSFRSQRMRGHLPDPMIIETPYGFKAGAKVKDRETGLYLAVPPYIAFLEAYITQVAGLGVLISAQKDIAPAYLDHKKSKLDSLLTKLTEAAASRPKIEIEEEVFILAIKRAADNMLVQAKYFPETAKKGFLKTLDSENYKKHIINRIESINPARLKTYDNIDAFWDGFITDNFSRLIMG